MKTFAILLIFIMMLSTGCTVNSSEKENIEAKKTYGIFKFDKDLFDFGVIKSGDTVYHDFTFTNTGKPPIIIYNVEAQCGCNKIEWPKGTIRPQATGKIRIGFAKQNLPFIKKQSPYTPIPPKRIMCCTLLPKLKTHTNPLQSKYIGMKTLQTTLGCVPLSLGK
ncbi:MAG: DUF1573 domain-containing protein [Pyrinomonadaceae bacterium]|nr:DUF1573 domain-containing protein [Sphingobacteriaceae bacterium]